MTRLYLIRHAEAEGNLYRVAHGHCNGLITNYRGYQQIDALRERFRKVDIDAVYSSDLYRTQITARAIWLPKALPLHLEPAFREICMGEWEDHTWHELNVRYPEGRPVACAGGRDGAAGGGPVYPGAGARGPGP